MTKCAAYPHLFYGVDTPQATYKFIIGKDSWMNLKAQI